MILLGLTSAITHAGWNALLKREQDTRAAAVVIIAGAALVSAALAVTIGPAQVPRPAWPAVAGAAVIEGVYFVALSSAMQKLSLQTAYGLSRGLGLLLVWPASVWLQGEAASPLHLGGAAVLSAGLFMLVERGGSRGGLAFAVLTAVTIAVYPLTYKAALAAGVAPFSLFALSLAGGLPAAFLALGREALPRVRAAMRWRLLFAALTCATSFLLFLRALESMGAAQLTAVRNTSVLFAFLMAWAMGEPRTPRTVLAAVMMTLGAIMVSF